MANIELDDEAQVSISEPMARDRVAAGTSAALVVAVAAAVAVVIAAMVASLTAVPAGAATTMDRPTSAWNASAPSADIQLRDDAAGGTKAAFVASPAPARDSIYRVVSIAAPAEQGKSLAMIVVVGMLLAMTAATSMLWRAFGRSVAEPARARRPSGSPAAKRAFPARRPNG